MFSPPHSLPILLLPVKAKADYPIIHSRSDFSCRSYRASVLGEWRISTTHLLNGTKAPICESNPTRKKVDSSTPITMPPLLRVSHDSYRVLFRHVFTSSPSGWVGQQSHGA
ncbi:hypothetical protein DER45DRAFT_339944 [Fusarium avenaceum]|nr:hypothetical protein DER45DRAFT_339944 [Fusarium avenaceum]